MTKIKNGDTFWTTKCGTVTVLDYVNAYKILVQFEDGFKKWSDSKSLRMGNVKNPYQPSLFGVGYVGEYESCTTAEYNCWMSMLYRCYSNSSDCNPTYQGCTVEPYWHCLSNFLQFYRENFREGFQIDKDLAKIGNRVYCREFCTFVPVEVNALVVNCGRARGLNPIGVSTHIEGRSYRARCDTGDPSKRKHIGCFYTPEAAFYAYKEYKEERIKDVAKKYKDVIDNRVYYNLMNYQVEITD